LLGFIMYVSAYGLARTDAAAAEAEEAPTLEATHNMWLSF
jgi:hypothetical protein